MSIFGPNGCGKSTLINMIAGILPIDAGEILFDGRKLEDVRIGYRLPELPGGRVPLVAGYRQYPLSPALSGLSKPEREARVERFWPPSM